MIQRASWLLSSLRYPASKIAGAAVHASRAAFVFPHQSGIVSKLLDEIGICFGTGTELRRARPGNTELKSSAMWNGQRQCFGQKESRPLSDSIASDGDVGEKRPWILRKPDSRDFHDVEGRMYLP
jgi:hypothetical protein